MRLLTIVALAFKLVRAGVQPGGASSVQGSSHAWRLGARAFAAALAASLSGCLQIGPDVTANDHPSASDVVNRLDLSPRSSSRAGTGQEDPKGAAAATAVYGDPVELTARAGAEVDPSGAYTLNFDKTPVATVAQSVLGDIFNVGYIIDPRAQGTISLSTGRPIPKKDLLFVLENALKASGLALVRDPTGYRILPTADNVVGAVDRAEGGGGVEPGYGLTVIPVQYISASALAKLMEGFATRPGAVRPDPSGRMLLVLGTGAERQAAVDTMRDFDVDWLRGQSVAIIPVHNSAPEPIVAELEKIMDAGESGLGHDLVKFQPVDRQNAVLVVAARPQLLHDAETWVSRLDGSTIGGPGARVYRLKYGDAKQIADLLARTFGAGGGSSSVDTAATLLAPGATPTTLSNIDRLTGGGKDEPQPSTLRPTSDRRLAVRRACGQIRLRFERFERDAHHARHRQQRAHHLRRRSDV